MYRKSNNRNEIAIISITSSPDHHLLMWNLEILKKIKCLYLGFLHLERY